jgi:hypothetical protein
MLASLVRHFPSPLLSSLSTSNYVQFQRPGWAQQSSLDICPILAMALGIPETRRFLMSLTGKTLAQMWPNWCHQLCRKKSRFHVPKQWPHCHFVKWPPENRIVFWGSQKKTIKPMEMRRRRDTKNMKSIEKRNTTQNPQTSKRQRRHVQLPTWRDECGKNLIISSLVYSWVFWSYAS